MPWQMKNKYFKMLEDVTFAHLEEREGALGGIGKDPLEEPYVWKLAHVRISFF